MGWSSIVLAQAQSLLSMMSPISNVLHTSVAENQDKPERQSIAANVRADCYDAALNPKSALSNQHSSQKNILHEHHGSLRLEHDVLDSKKHCQNNHITLSKTQCNDCAQMSCQSLVTLVNTQNLQFEFSNQNIETLYPQYFAQNLIGFWQEILRPPKT
ncbi:hypothetical protein [Acinetobacter sp. KS-LM10]|uniref:hypothetical protein n=1 Tax=Acinetobacter sp. KS-LM10 TaxID=3120518 RepID=UPI0030D3494D